MTAPQQPQPQWVFAPAPKRRTGRVILLVLLALVVVAIAVAVVVFALPKAAPAPSDSPSPTASSASATPTRTPSPSPTPSRSATPTSTPSPTAVVTPPPIEVPELSPFAESVAPRLDDAETGLGFIGESSGAEAASYVDDLVRDAQNLSDAVAPADIATSWHAAVATYMGSLEKIRTAANAGNDLTASIDTARADVAALRELVGL